MSAPAKLPAEPFPEAPVLAQRLENTIVALVDAVGWTGTFEQIDAAVKRAVKRRSVDSGWIA